MNWMEALLLECQMSVQDFTKAVEAFLKENILQVSIASVTGISMLFMFFSCQFLLTHLRNTGIGYIDFL